MKIVIKDVQQNPVTTLRRAGYHFERQRPDTGQVSAARSLGLGGFPRFHAYAKLVGSDLHINLHLDQKSPVYKGTSAHGGEYQGKILEQEAARIKSILNK